MMSSVEQLTNAHDAMPLVHLSPLTVAQVAEYKKLLDDNIEHFSQFNNMHKNRDTSIAKLTEEMNAGQKHRFGIYTADGSLVGIISYVPMPSFGAADKITKKENVEIGYLLAKSATGEGYMTSALTQLLTQLEASGKYFEAVAYVHIDNNASAQVLKRCGFKNGVLMDQKMRMFTKRLDIA